MSTQFFKVTLQNKHLVSVYSGSGKKQTVQQEERVIEQVIGGLPHSTALAYRAAQPNCVIEIDHSYNAHDSRAPIRVRESGSERPMKVRKAASPAPAPAPAPASSIISGGDYADLVNKLAGKAA